MTKPELALYWSDDKQDGRAYKHPHTGQRVVSVTTVTGMEDKPALVQWAVNLTIKWACENWMSIGNRSDQSTLQWGRYRHKDVLDERAEIGTDTHEWAEAYFRGDWSLPELEGEAAECAEQLLLLCETHEVVPVYIETTAWNAEEEYAGTADLIAYVDGVLTLIDLKTSKNVYDSHRMQVTALSKCPKLLTKVDGEWQEIDAPVYEQLGFFHVRADTADPFSGEIKPAYWEFAVVDTKETENLYDMFRGYKKVYYAQQELKASRKGGI